MRTEGDPRQALQEGHPARRVVAQAPGGERRSHPGRAQRGLRGALRAEGLHLHRGEGHPPSCPMAAGRSEKSPRKPPSATSKRGACGGGWLAASTPGASCS